MTDLARNGSILVAEIKAIHPANGSDATNGAVPHANGDANGSAILSKAAPTLPATAGAGAAAPIESSITDPATQPHLGNGHAHQATDLSIGAGAVAVPHQADTSVASGIADPVAQSPAPTATDAAAPGLVQPQTTAIQPVQPNDHAREVSHINTAVPAAGVGAAAATAADPAAAAAAPDAPAAVVAAAAASPAAAAAAPEVEAWTGCNT